jgi:glycosyltransferase involved in cell wall biosynthesis
VGINGHGLTGGEAMKMAEQIQRSLFVEEYGISMKVVNLPEVKGKVGALHALVGLSKGEWIALLDCDDKWAPHKLILQKIAVDSIAKEAGVIGTLCWYFGDWESEGPSLPSGWVPPAAFKEMNPIINSSAIMKREYALWTDEWWGLDDYELWLRLRSEGVKFYNIPLRLVYHRIHAASAFNSSGKQDVKGLISKYFKEEEC